jgi:aspartate-semialdehyde dehydrogenase
LFHLTWLGASERSAGKRYSEAAKWHLGGAAPADIASRKVEDAKPGNAPKLVFSAMDASVATEIEQAFAAAGHVVVSNSRNHRMEADVPLLVPEINPEHLKLVPLQQKKRGWKGAIVTNPNCSTIVLTMGLAPIMQFGVTKIIATTLQAISGAGYPARIAIASRWWTATLSRCRCSLRTNPRMQMCCTLSRVSVDFRRSVICRARRSCLCST